ncbi:hypothetical protein LSAT2_011130 [Lamellibrachia satsuma]|nr:hypothetical protein LSAT2_011130 [Lamellibrachia satsuma]
MVNTDGSVETIIASTGFPLGLAVDFKKRLLFYAEYITAENTTVYKANLDGSKLSTIDITRRVLEITLLINKGMICWSDFDLKHIKCTDFSGNHSSVYNTIGNPQGIAAKDGVAYYTQNSPNRVTAMQLEDGSETVINIGSYNPSYDIAVLYGDGGTPESTKAVDAVITYPPRSFQTPTTSTHGATANININDKGKTEHFALTAVGILSGLLTVALVISIVIHTRRQHCVKDRAVDTEDDPCTHYTPELKDRTTPVYDTAAVSETTSTKNDVLSSGNDVSPSVDKFGSSADDVGPSADEIGPSVDDVSRSADDVGYDM